MDWSSPIAQYLKMDAGAASVSGGLFATMGSACQASVERAIGRTFEAKEYTEAYNGNDRGTLFFRHDPVLSVASVTISGAAMTIADPDVPVYPTAQIAIEPTAQGIVRADGGLFSLGFSNVIATYTAGLAAVDGGAPPADLAFAVTYWAGMFFRDRDRLGLSSETVGAQVTAYTRALPPSVVQMIRAWRRPLIPC